MAVNPQSKVKWATTTKDPSTVGGWIGDAIKNATKPVDTPGTPTTPASPSGNFEDALSGDNKSAYLAITNLFNSYGLSSLAPKVYDYIVKGYQADAIGILLQQSKEYKERFAANEARQKAGLPVLDPKDYIALESAYRQYMHQAGLPAGFYDQTSDFTDFISKDVSPTEVQSRVQLASQATALASPEYKKALNDVYGIDDAHLTAYFLDSDRALPMLQKQASAASIAAEATKRGITTGKEELENLVTAGVDAQQAAQVYGVIATSGEGFQQAAGSFGEDLTQAELKQGLFTQGSEAGQKITRLQSWQRARQQGAGGGAQSGLGKRGTT